MKTPEHRKQYVKEYYIKNRDAIIYRAVEYYKNNKGKVRRYKKIWREKNQIVLAHKQKITRERCLKSWEGFIPVESSCEICGRPLLFNRNDRKKAVHFDHRNGYTKIKTTPIIWLRSHIRNTKNEVVWSEANFGKLCLRCNTSLPTENRKEFLLNALKYTEQL